ncbi:hypothetical protein DMC30DRAFT_386484 [Rhodotorula diobovata]|uniref:Proteophosphoglycan ppg4 n=1 Tax=Rhodotorula diobovata TaxID=5288 RepID=A0A5C5G5Q9_9BASI|nr:hypothetical protein DMC30DRAFT_386484 [Rhodotorula diobovata]
MYASPPALSTLRTSCTTLLSGCPTSLTSLSISLSPLGFPPIPFTVLFPSSSAASLKALISLTYLSSFTLSGATSVWLHDLVPLLAAWAPSLRALELALLRGDCTRPPPVEGERPRALRALRVRESTLPGEMVAWLLDGQTRLEELEMPLPGAEGPAWEAVGRVVSRVEVLKVWDRWGGAAGSGAWKGKAKAATNRVITLAKEVEVDELASDAGDDTEGDTAAALQPPSPLLDLVRRAPVLRTVFLPASLVPIPSSFASLLPHLARVSTLLIEDAPSTGLRKAVEAALVDEVAGLGGLEKVVSVVKKGKGDKQKAKAFAKRCAEKGVEWEVREAA